MVIFGISVPTGREGLMVPPGFASKETIVEAAVLAEEYGYDSVWGNDHITVQDYVKQISPKSSFLSPLISLAAISSVTERVKLGIGIFVLPWRTPAIVICAKQIATLDALSGGRLLLGIGTGAYPEESRAIGITDNLVRMNEGVEALRLLFQQDHASYQSRFIEFNGVNLYPKPVQKPFPIYLGRHLTSDNVLKWLAKNGQGWIPGLTPEQFNEAVPRLSKYLKENSRKLSEIDIVREISLSQADTLEKAVEKYKNSPAQAHMNSLSKGKKLVDFDEEMRYSLIGTPDDIIKGIEAYLDVGVTHFMFNLTVRKPDEFFEGIRAFSEKVMPSFK